MDALLRGEALDASRALVPSDCLNQDLLDEWIK